MPLTFSREPNATAGSTSDADADPNAITMAVKTVNALAVNIARLQIDRPLLCEDPVMRHWLLTLALLSSSALSLSHAPALRAVDRLDLDRYAGTWYEIAKYPNRFQARCVADTIARYRRTGDTVEVFNRCRLADGSYIDVMGVARRVGTEGSAVLEVRFAPAWLAWLSAVWAPYWVFDLDPEYTLAAVGQPGREYLWILSRTPHVDPARYTALLRRIEAAGYDTGRLELTPQGP